jgi:hypothetical protein
LLVSSLPTLTAVAVLLLCLLSCRAAAAASELCKGLMELARDRLVRSRVASGGLQETQQAGNFERERCSDCMRDMLV